MARLGETGAAQGLFFKRQFAPLVLAELQAQAVHLTQLLTLTKPISAAFSRKHWRQMFRPYLRMTAWLLPHTLLRGTKPGQEDLSMHPARLRRQRAARPCRCSMAARARWLPMDWLCIRLLAGLLGGWVIRPAAEMPRTRSASPARSSWGASSTRYRGPWRLRGEPGVLGEAPKLTLVPDLKLPVLQQWPHRVGCSATGCNDVYAGKERATSVWRALKAQANARVPAQPTRVRRTMQQPQGPGTLRPSCWA